MRGRGRRRMRRKRIEEEEGGGRFLKKCPTGRDGILEIHLEEQSFA